MVGQALADAKLVVEENVEQGIPDKYGDASLGVNPGFKDRTLLDKLKSIIYGVGYLQIDEYRWAEGSHYYSPGHVGLYLRSRVHEGGYRMPPFLRTRKCQHGDATLQFLPDGRLVLEYEKDSDTLELARRSGQWKLIGSDLRVTFDDSRINQEFRLQRRQVETYLGMRPADVFTPNRAIEGMALLNCPYLIIYMN